MAGNPGHHLVEPHVQGPARLNLPPGLDRMAGLGVGQAERDTGSEKAIREKYSTHAFQRAAMGGLERRWVEGWA